MPNRNRQKSKSETAIIVSPQNRLTNIEIMIIPSLLFAVSLLCSHVGATFTRSGAFKHLPEDYTLSEPIASTIARGIKPGWAFQLQYPNDNCGGGQPFAISAFKTNVCFNFNVTFPIDAVNVEVYYFSMMVTCGIRKFVHTFCTLFNAGVIHRIWRTSYVQWTKLSS